MKFRRYYKMNLVFLENRKTLSIQANCQSAPALSFSGKCSGHCIRSVHRYVETTLLHLVFYKASVLHAHIVEHLAEHPFQGVIAYFATLRTLGRFHCFVAVVANVEGGAVEVAAVLGGITVVPAEPGYVGLAAKH